VANQIAHENYFLGRFDYMLSPKDAIFGRYILDKTDFIEPFGGGGFGGNQGIASWPESDKSEADFSTLEWRRVITPSLINVARIHYSRTSTDAFTSNSTSPLQFFPNSGRQDATITVSGLSGIGGALQLPFNEVQNRYTEGDDVSWIHGAHTVRFGGSVSRLQTNTYMPFRQGSMWVFAGLPGLLGGVPLVMSYTPLVLPAGQPGAGGPSYPNRDFRDLEFMPYIQDDWKVSPKLTLNFGLRYEFITNPVDNHDQLYAITNFATATSFSHVDHIMANNPNTKNFAPRVGFAYDPFADHKTSIRGGFGMFYNLFLPPDYAPAYWDQPPYPTFQAGITVPGTTPPLYPTIPAAGRALLTSSPGWDWANHNTPYMMQYNLNVQRELFSNTVLTVGYVGSRGIHLLTEKEQNPMVVTLDANGRQHFGTINPANGAVVDNPRVNPGLGSFPDMIPTTTLRYNSLQTTLNRRFSQNFQVQVSYTYSRCVDLGAYGLGSFTANAPAIWTNPYNQNEDKGRCSYDLNHVLGANGLVALPFKGNRVVEGWQISGILRSSSGIPFTVSDGVDASGLGVTTVRPNVVAGCEHYIGRPSQWFDPNCFTLQPLTTLGNLGRTTEIGPRFNNTDIAVRKDTKITEQLLVQFRAEFFNIFNHPNYAVPGQQNTNASLFTAIANGQGVRNPNAGRITAIAGIPRQIQFALKLIF
jgi:hypothetical protein